MRIYKILTKDEFEEFEGIEEWKGTSMDISDGFIHLSGKNHVERVANAYYSAHEELHVLSFEYLAIKPYIKWEEAVNTTDSFLMPHLFGTLNLKQGILQIIKKEGSQFNTADLD